MLLYAFLVCLPFIGANAKWIPDRERIVNGTDAKPGEIPYIVSVRLNNRFICGGSILDSHHILTAARCTVNLRGGFAIQYGITDLASSPNVIAVVKVISHEYYNPSKIQNDVAVLKLRQAIVYSELVQPIALPAQGETPPAYQWAVLSGWGISYPGGIVMRHLQRVDLLIYSDIDCSSAHGIRVDSFHNVCGGVPEGGKGQCTGDSGGPLVANGKQYGIVSWTVKPCAVKGYPGVYTRVPSYVDWIKKQMSL